MHDRAGAGMNYRVSANCPARPRMFLRIRREAQLSLRGINLMNSTPSSQPDVSNSVPVSVPPTLLPGDTHYHRPSPVVENVPASAELGPRRVGYGLPCVKCKTYYAADLSACPVCKTEERMPPMPVVVSAHAGQQLPQPVAPDPDDIALEAERERFLGEFKARVYESDGQIDAAMDAPAASACSLESGHLGIFKPATVCQECYARLQGRVDLLEAALHMEVKEATQLIYDAVWSDPSDPSKTYHNAAQAVLIELRKRAGIQAVLGPLKTLSH